MYQIDIGIQNHLHRRQGFDHLNRRFLSTSRHRHQRNHDGEKVRFPPDSARPLDAWQHLFSYSWRLLLFQQLSKPYPARRIDSNFSHTLHA